MNVAADLHLWVVCIVRWTGKCLTRVFDDLEEAQDFLDATEQHGGFKAYFWELTEPEKP